MKEGVRMNEQINRKKSYGLMIIAMLLYGVDLAAVYYCTQLLYKNIVEITVIVVLVPIYFIIWALRGKEGKAQELKCSIEKLSSTSGRGKWKSLFHRILVDFTLS